MGKIKNQPILGLIVVMSPYIDPPIAVKTAVITQVQITTHSTLIPETLAKSILSATARMALPTLVFCNNKCKPIIATKARTITTNRLYSSLNPKIS